MDAQGPVMNVYKMAFLDRDGEGGAIMAFLNRNGYNIKHDPTTEKFPEKQPLSMRNYMPMVMWSLWRLLLKTVHDDKKLDVFFADYVLKSIGESFIYLLGMLVFLHSKGNAEADNYMETLRSLAAKCYVAYPSIKKHVSVLKRFEALFADEMTRVNRPTYAEKFVRQPWQQFIGKNSLGWFEGNAKAPGVISRQHIPNGGIKIVEKWEEQAKQVFKKLDEELGHGGSRFSSGLTDALSRPKPKYSGKAIQTVELTSLDESPYSEQYNRPLPAYKGDLFPHSKMLARLRKNDDEDVAEPQEWRFATVETKIVEKKLS